MYIKDMDKTYSYLYEYIDIFTKKMNPCNISIIKIGGVDTLTCVKYPHGNDNGSLCCGTYEGSTDPIFTTNCKHCTSKGCSVKSLSCKIYFCDAAWDNLIFRFGRIYQKGEQNYLREFIEAIQYVSQMMRLHSIPALPRRSKKENFEKFRILTNRDYIRFLKGYQTDFRILIGKKY